jgi:hypothetical protein
MGFSLATLDDYVDLLDELRARLIQHIDIDPNLRIKFYVFTTQLPRDWPLWDLSVTEATPGKTKLEDYTLNLRSFIRHQNSIDLKRIVIIENADSPRGQLRLRWLGDDVNNNACFREYIDKLHKHENQALFCTYKRPWPSWLSDTVLYGLEDKTTNQSEWLWAVTTSYRPGSDLMSLQFHRMTDSTMSKKYVFPWSYHSFVTLADKTADLEKDKELKKLTTLRPSGGEGQPLQPPSGGLPGPNFTGRTSPMTDGTNPRAPKPASTKKQQKRRT